MTRIRTALLCLVLCVGASIQSRAAEGAPTYAETIAKARKLMDDGKLAEAYLTSSAAITIDEKRWEAYALVALVLNAQGANTEAKPYLEKALARAPEDKKVTLHEIEKKLNSATSPLSTPPADSSDVEQKRKFETLKLIIADADASTDKNDRARFLREFMTRSEPFVEQYPSQSSVWLLRAAAAVELNDRDAGWKAGVNLKKLGMDKSAEAGAIKVMAALDRKGWLGTVLEKYPTLDANYENSLGMKFVPVPGTIVLFGIWDTRVQDFATFVRDSGYNATEGMYSLRSDGWKQRGDTWKSPGFVQGPTHPVCGVNWDDAQAFCRWLTAKERGKGLLGETQSYRLPTDAEWSIAVGNDRYPWGNQWPPPAGAGNYAGSEAADGNWPSNFGTIPGYQDGFPRTSPVGSFAANRLGLFDMGGNVWQWCEDWYRKEMNTPEIRQQIPALDNDGGGQQFRVLRGASWFAYGASGALSWFRFRDLPGFRYDFFGFRCVLVAGGVVR